MNLEARRGCSMTDTFGRGSRPKLYSNEGCHASVQGTRRDQKSLVTGAFARCLHRSLAMSANAKENRRSQGTRIILRQRDRSVKRQDCRQKLHPEPGLDSVHDKPGLCHDWSCKILTIAAGNSLATSFGHYILFCLCFGPSCGLATPRVSLLFRGLQINS